MKIINMVRLAVVVLCGVGILGSGEVVAGLIAMVLLLILVTLVGAAVSKVVGTASAPGGRPRGGPAPVTDGRERPRPGDVWWADIPFEDSQESKDRPCLVLKVTGPRVTALKITSKDRSGRDDCVRIPKGVIDDPTGAGRESWLELNEQRTFDIARMRRRAGSVPGKVWERVRHAHPA
ncbi:hypothetical protein GCM10022221_19930 [Actinocorallia aurea]